MYTYISFSLSHYIYIYTHTCIHTHTYIYIYIYIHLIHVQGHLGHEEGAQAADPSAPDDARSGHVT